MKTALDSSRRDILDKVRRVVFTNPFSAERARLDAEILDRPAPARTRAASLRDQSDEHENALRVAALTRRELEAIPEADRRAILNGNDADALLLRDAIGFLLFYQYYKPMDELIERTIDGEEIETHKQGVTFYASFEREIARWFDLREDGVSGPGGMGPEGAGKLVVDRAWAARIFAFCYQLRRAYYFIYYRIIGTSPAMMQLRESVWDAVFTRNLEWYWRFLMGRMSDFSTLITGPTGSGKESVAQAICRAQYVPFNPRTKRFETGERALFLPLNLAALSATLLESELFGHVKGAFTGATEARDGLMASCSPAGGVFLDEIGELDPSMQVKLLRVLQTRCFFPLGGRRVKRFEGRVVSATNQDVARLIREGRMREDFYYRLSACTVATPSLRRRFDEDPDEITHLSRFLIRRMIGMERQEIEEPLIESVRIATKAGRPWRGNVRELEQFLRRCLTGGDQPIGAHTAGPDDAEAWIGRAAQGGLTLDELLRHYCREARARHGNWEKAATALRADWRTIKKYAEYDEKGERQG